MSKSTGGMVFISSILIALLFIGTVYVNLGIKDTKKMILDKYKKIDEYRVDLKRLKIEIAALTNPQDILIYAEKNNMKSVPLDSVKPIEIYKDKTKK